MQTQHHLPQSDKTLPLISFIITYYNEPIDMIKKCIDSILKLTLSAEEREIIVIDDGSDISPLNLVKPETLVLQWQRDNIFSL